MVYNMGKACRCVLSSNMHAKGEYSLVGSVMDQRFRKKGLHVSMANAHGLVWECSFYVCLFVCLFVWGLHGNLS